MNEVNTSVEVPETSQNSNITPTTAANANSSQTGGNQSQVTSEITPTIVTNKTQKPITKTGTGGNFAIIAVLFILIILMFLILIFRDKLMVIIKKNLKIK